MKTIRALLSVWIYALREAGAEPVYNVVVYGESSGAVIAAGMAIDLHSSVKTVPYPALRGKLEAAKP